MPVPFKCLPSLSADGTSSCFAKSVESMKQGLSILVPTSCPLHLHWSSPCFSSPAESRMHSSPRTVSGYSIFESHSHDFIYVLLFSYFFIKSFLTLQLLFPCRDSLITINTLPTVYKFLSSNKQARDSTSSSGCCLLLFSLL